MRIVIAPDSFKESASAVAAAAALAAGVHDVVPDAECLEIPMADGGEGFAETVAAALGLELIDQQVTGPLGHPVTAGFALDPDHRLAVLDVASAVGIGLVPRDERDILSAGSRGVGELVAAALDREADRLVIGLGGSVTNDGGAGLLAGLGARLLDAAGTELRDGPAALERLDHIDWSGLHPRVREATIELASDVTNPLLGPDGASAVFGPQKGARPEDVVRLDSLLAHFAEVVDPERAHVDSPGAGAAGGLGFAFQCLGARTRPGVDVVAELVGLDDACAGADLVFTGEGAMDRQTLSGKTPFGVAQRAVAHGVPVIGFAGYLGDGADELLDHGFWALVPIVREVCDLPTALRDGEANLRKAAALAMRLAGLGKR